MTSQLNWNLKYQEQLLQRLIFLILLFTLIRFERLRYEDECLAKCAGIYKKRREANKKMKVLKENVLVFFNILLYLFIKLGKVYPMIFILYFLKIVNGVEFNDFKVYSLNLFIFINQVKSSV